MWTHKNSDLNTITNLSCSPTKADIVHFYSKFSNLSPISSINISQHVVSASKKARNLGVIFDCHLTMSSHIDSICRFAYLALRNIGRVRKYLNQANTERLVHAFITPRLDYCNSLLYELSAKVITKLTNACKTLRPDLLRNANYEST